MSSLLSSYFSLKIQLISPQWQRDGITTEQNKTHSSLGNRTHVFFSGSYITTILERSICTHLCFFVLWQKENTSDNSPSHWDHVMGGLYVVFPASTPLLCLLFLSAYFSLKIQLISPR